MSPRLPFTQAKVRRAIKAAESAGYRVGGIRPDGTVLVYTGDERPDDLSIAPNHDDNPGGTSWDDR
jgi:hypothetical protein